MSNIERHASKKILVLWWYEPSEEPRPAIAHHLHLMDHSPCKHRIHYYRLGNRQIPYWLKWTSYDVIILHTSLLCLRWNRMFPRVKQQLEWLKNVKAQKIALPQDEYDFSEILDEWMYELNVDLIGSNFDEDLREVLYPLMTTQTQFFKCLTGYIDEPTAKQMAPLLLPLADRQLDIVYRATQLPYYYGSHGQLKHSIGGIVASRAEELGLRCDISTQPGDTITSEKWFHFLAASKATIGCESGSSVIDRRGAIQEYVNWRLSHHPGLTFEDISKELPVGWDSYEFFALSPRHFEAVITKTCQILVEGKYDGILVPDRHYIPLRKDFENLDEVLHKVQDTQLLEKMTNQAYEDFYESGKYTYTNGISRLDEVIAECPQQETVANTAAIPAIRVLEETVRFTTRVAFFLLKLPIILIPYSGLVFFLLAKFPRVISQPLLRAMLFQCCKGKERKKIGKDFLKLLIIQRLKSMSTSPTAVSVDLELNQQAIQIVTKPIQQANESVSERVILEKSEVIEKIRSGEIQHIRWDHTQVDEMIRVYIGITREGGYFLHPNQKHTFEGLELLMRQNPDLMLSLLLYITGKQGVSIQAESVQVDTSDEGNYVAA